MNLLLTCEDVLRFMPDYQESVLAPTLRMRFSMHLKMCKPCRAMLESVQAIPRIFQRAISGDAAAPPVEARKALDSVMARLQAGGRLIPMAAPGWRASAERASVHPMPARVEQAVAEGTADLPLRLMAKTYQAIQERGGALDAEPFLPEAVLEELPPMERWRWSKALLNGCSSAMLAKDPHTGASLHMILMPTGRYFPNHLHQGDEHVLLLAGQVEDSEYYGVAGDWFHHASGTEHRNLQGRGTDVCWTLSRLSDPGVRLSGWRGALQTLTGRVS